MGERVILAVVLSILLCGVVYTRRIAWEPTYKPPVSLRVALSLAEEELQKQQIGYFCIGAELAKTFSAGDWALHFSSKEGKEIWVNVSSDKKITKSKEGFEY